MLARIGRGNVLINYDTANVEFYGGVMAVDDLPAAMPKLVHCHLTDKRGEGRLWDFPAIGEPSRRRYSIRSDIVREAGIPVAGSLMISP